ncbi:MAG: nucleotidyl transferase AbiEii/AbiGii toxin family protein [Candidatus Dormibacteraceae bacterium]
MIPNPAITEWGNVRPWPTRTQIEQDLLLSRLIIEIANHPYLGEELIFRGGTCLHKLHLEKPRRYSEDLDYVRSTAGGIQPFTKALCDLGKQLGFEINTRISQHPKVYFRTMSSDGVRIRIKVEANTYERSSAEPIITAPFAVSSQWFEGGAQVRTFTTAELMATKVRALYQRKKGRDLFDLWLAMTEMQLEAKQIIAAFAPYRPVGLTTVTATQNLQRKVIDEEFCNDLFPLVNSWPPRYSVEIAANLVISKVFSLL